jgi:hypothetical protein
MPSWVQDLPQNHFIQVSIIEFCLIESVISRLIINIIFVCLKKPVPSLQEVIVRCAVIILVHGIDTESGKAPWEFFNHMEPICTDQAVRQAAPCDITVWIP